MPEYWSKLSPPETLRLRVRIYGWIGLRVWAFLRDYDMADGQMRNLT